jgi:putative ABC transport system permease protein
MLRLTVAQMRRSPGRLAAGGLAIALGSAFVTVALLAGDVLTRTTYRAVTASYANADIVVEGWDLTDSDAAAIRETPRVTGAEAQVWTYLEVTGSDGTLWLEIDALADDPRLEPRELLAGEAPGQGEIALPDSAAASLGLEIGDTASITLRSWSDEKQKVPSVRSVSLTVSGLVDDAASGLVGTPVALAARSQVFDWMAFEMPDEPVFSSVILVTIDDGADPQATKAAVRASLTETNPSVDETTVRTLDEQAEWIVSDLTHESRMLATIGLGFAAIALLVAALVIANTFQVLVAQRTRTLALLRCVGADRAQLRRSVIIEALLLGGIAAAAGLLLGIGLVQGALLVLGQTMPNVPLPSTATVTPWSVLAPLVVGVGVTVVAALAPARAATRVSPLAAMRPTGAPRVAERSGLVRMVVSIALVLAGVLAMIGGLHVATSSEVALGLALGLLGGTLSFFGVLLGAVFWIPPAVTLVARIGKRTPSTRLAAANIVRNPGRTVATAGALVIGVTLVAMMATGASTARAALDSRLDEEYPFDIVARSMDDMGNSDEMPPDVTRTAVEADGVAEVAGLTGTYLGLVTAHDGTLMVDTIGLDPADGRRVLRSDDQIAGLQNGTVLVPQSVADWTGITDGETITLGPMDPDDLWSDAEPSVRPKDQVRLTAVLTTLPCSSLVLTRSDLADISGNLPDSVLWVLLDKRADAGDVVATLEAAASRAPSSGVYVSGAATERAAYQDVISTLLAIVIGLLAVSVVIALVGVANTLWLSVIERRRESATLRAIGLSRRQLSASLAVEGVIIAGVGALAGTIIGTAYGWIGTRIVLNQVGPTPFTVAWREIGLVVAVALAAGLVASALPARSAVRTSPVEALAVE